MVDQRPVGDLLQGEIDLLDLVLHSQPLGPVAEVPGRRANAANTIHLPADPADFEEMLQLIRFCIQESTHYALSG